MRLHDRGPATAGPAPGVGWSGQDDRAEVQRHRAHLRPDPDRADPRRNVERAPDARHAGELEVRRISSRGRRRRPLSRGSNPRQREGTFDGRSLAGLALDEKLATEQFGDALGDEKTESGALLLEGFSLELNVWADPPDLVGRHASPLVRHDEMELVGMGFRGDEHRLAWLGKLEGVVEDLLDDLGKVFRRHAQTDLVAFQE